MNTKKGMLPQAQKGFTLIELLIVIAIIAILAVVVVLTVNPAQLLMQSRDSNRVSSLSTINNAVAFAKANGLSLGTPNIAYVSVPDPTLTGNQTSTCASLGLPAIASTTYQCVSPANLTNNNGTGWIPIAFNTLPGSPLGTIPVDPVNATSSKEYFIYTTNGTGYEVMANPEAANDVSNTADFKNGSTLTLLTSFPGTGGGTPNSSKNIWVVDPGNYRVEEFSASGTYESQFGSLGSGNGQFSYPTGIAFDVSGNIWVADQGDNRVEEFSSGGTYESQFGSSGSGNGQFSYSTGIAFDASGNIWVVDQGNNRVEEFSSGGTYESQFGSSGSGNGQFSGAIGIAIDGSGNIWVTDQGNNRVEEFSSGGTYESQFGSLGSGNGQFSGAVGIAIDGSGNIWVADGGNNRVEEFSSAGTYESQLGCPSGGCSPGSGNGQFNRPVGLAIDGSGNIWVTDGNNNRVEEFSSAGAYESQFGSLGSGNGQFNDPLGIAIH